MAEGDSDPGQGRAAIHDVSLSSFKPSIFKRYRRADHLDLLDEYLAQVTAFVESDGQEGIGRLIVEMPPRHGKSLTTSFLWPIYHLGRNPDHRLMLVSYQARLAQRNSRFCRNAIGAPIYRQLTGLELAKDSYAVESWNLNGYDGGMDALGIQSGATGKGAHLLVIDDPYASREEAESRTIRDKVWDGFNDDLMTRLEPGGAAVVMMTRWHVDDIIGRLLLNDTDEWTRLRMPALAEDDDVLEREQDTALWPDRYSTEWLLAERDRRNVYSWSSLYQQNPILAEGGLFKRDKFKIVDDLPGHLVKEGRAWDLALSSRETADFTAGVRGGVTDGLDLVITDVQRFQRDWDEVTPEVAKTALVDGEKIAIGVETAFFHSQAVRKLLKMPELVRHSIRGYKPDTDKFTRALPVADRVGEGMVYVLRRPWTDAYIDELCAFKDGKGELHNDQVDATSLLWLMLATRRKLTAEYSPF